MSEKYVLLVEDNADDELLAVRAFEKSNIKNIVVVRDGAEALDFIFGAGKYSSRDVKHLPEFVLLDLKLPKMDGIEVLEKIRNSPLTKLLPVIVLTSSQEEHDLHSCYLNGANSFVVKPMDYDDFLKLIRTLSSYWLEMNKTPQNKCATA